MKVENIIKGLQLNLQNQLSNRNNIRAYIGQKYS